MRTEMFSEVVTVCPVCRTPVNESENPEYEFWCPGCDDGYTASEVEEEYEYFEMGDSAKEWGRGYYA